MNYLFWEVDAGPGDVVEVTLDRQANVKLMDYSNYQNYRAGTQYRYYGGLAKVSPVRVPVPAQGHWYVVVDLGGYPGTVHAAVRVNRRA